MTQASFMMAWRLKGLKVLIVGGGKEADGRLQLALNAGANIVHVAPSFTELGEALGEAGRITLVRRTVESSDLDGVDMLLVTVDELEEAGNIAKEARALRIPTNVADVPKQCDFWFPASFTEGPIQVAISTNGQSPAGASRLKRFFHMALPSSARGAIERLGQWRAEQRKIVNSAAVRMSRAARQARQSWKVMPTPLGESVRGRVTLVGAGPGDPDLLTIAAIDALSAADLVVADRLVPKAIMDLVSCELRIARKWRGRADAAQDELNQWVLDGARAGKQVVRLKCGDPFVFGRGREELDWLDKHGIESEVVPGVSSAFAAPAAAGIPVTSRGYADRVTMLTARG
ncbi:MAG: SAM-dependent methyltransferase, partial [Bradymonadia bacterium]